MNTTIDNRLDEVFCEYPSSPQLSDLKAELRADLTAQVREAVQQGAAADEAARTVLTRFGDLNAVVAEVANDSTPHEAAAHQLDRVRPGVGFILRTVALSLVVLASAVVVATGAIGVFALPSAVLFVVLAVGVAIPAGVITADSLRQETTQHYPMPRRRALAYAMAAVVGVAGVGLVGIGFTDPGMLIPLAVTGGVLLVTSIAGLIILGVTQTNRAKAWVHELHREHYGQDRFSQDPMAAARFGIYTVVIWTVAIAAFIVLTIKLSIVVSWLALVAGFVVFMLVLATMLFGPEGN